MNNPPVFPSELTPELDDALGLMTYQTALLARAYRDAGIAPELPRKIEREQAYMLHKIILLVLAHGPEWRFKFAEELKPVLDKAEANLAEKAIK